MLKSTLAFAAGVLVAASFAVSAHAEDNCKSLAEIRIIDGNGKIVGTFRELVPSVYTDGYRRLGDSLPQQGIWINNTPTVLKEIAAELGSDSDGDGYLTQAEFEQLAIDYLIKKAGYDGAVSADGSPLDVTEICSNDLRGLERGIKDDEQFGPTVTQLQGETDQGSSGDQSGGGEGTGK